MNLLRMYDTALLFIYLMFRNYIVYINWKKIIIGKGPTFQSDMISKISTESM